MIFRIWLIVTIMTTMLFSCSDGGEEAKERVKSKKDIVEKVRDREVKLTQIDLAKIPHDTEELEKVIRMSQEEVAARLGDYEFDAKLVYDTRRNEKELTLLEKQRLEHNKNGDFHITIFNDKNKTFEMFWIDGKLIDKVGYADFHQSTSVGKHLFWREKIYSAHDRFYKLFRGRLKFRSDGEETIAGRKALKISVKLDPNGTTPEEDLKPKFNYPNQYALSAIATDKLINSSRKRISRFIDAKATFWIDRQETVILKYTLEGQYAVPLSEKNMKQLKAQGVDSPGMEVIFVMKSDYEIKNIGTPHTFVIPRAKPPMKRDKPNLDPLDYMPNDPGIEVSKEAKIEQAKKGPLPSPTGNSDALPQDSTDAPSSPDTETGSQQPTDAAQPAPSPAQDTPSSGTEVTP